MFNYVDTATVLESLPSINIFRILLNMFAILIFLFNDVIKFN